MFDNVCVVCRLGGDQLGPTGSLGSAKGLASGGPESQSLGSDGNGALGSPLVGGGAGTTSLGLPPSSISQALQGAPLQLSHETHA